MPGRPIDHERRAELLDAVVDYAVQHGFADLSWRPVATGVGVSTTALVHRFGTKEAMLVAIMLRLRERITEAAQIVPPGQVSLASAARMAWERTSDPARAGEFRLFFAVYGEALQAPRQFGGFLTGVVSEWMAMLVSAQRPNVDPAIAAERATLVIATIRGLLLDLLATGDRQRVDAAASSFIAGLETERTP